MMLFFAVLLFLLSQRQNLGIHYPEKLQLLGNFAPGQPYAPGPHWGTSVPRPTLYSWTPLGDFRPKTP